MKGKKNKAKAGSAQKRPKELPGGATSCPLSLGRAWLTYGRFQTDTHTIRLGYESDAVTAGAGLWNPSFGNSPTGLSNWTNYAAVFDEYRIIAYEFSFIPLQYNGSVVVQAPIAIVVDLDTGTALTSYLLAARYPSSAEYPGGRSFKHLALMSGPEHSGFVTTASPITNMWFLLYTTGGTASTTIGRVKINYVVQFRSPGI